MKNHRKSLRVLWTAALTVLLCLCGPAMRAEADNMILQIGLRDYVETVYDESSGMPTSEANTILQDEMGYIWIGSYGGLIRYNGVDFENMSIGRENAPKSGIRVLYLDSRSRIWIGTNDGGIYLFSEEKFIRITESGDPEELFVEDLSVRCIEEGSDGLIYVGTTSGLLTVDERLTVSRAGQERLQNATVESLLNDREGNLWGITSDSYLFVLREGETLLELDRDYFDVGLSYGLLQDEEGRIYIGTESSYVIRLTGQASDWTAERVSKEMLSMDSKETVNDIYQDHQGYIWICTDNGIGYFDGEDTFYKINSQNTTTIMTQMCEDYEGNLWFASSRQGCVKLTKSKFQNVSYEAGIAGQTVNAAILYQDALYMGTDNGLALVDAEGNMVDNELTRMLDGIRIRSFMVDSENNLWISTYREYGLLMYQGRTGDTVSYTVSEGMPHDQVRMSYQLLDGRIAVATNGGAAILENGRVTKTYTGKDGIQNEVILCLTENLDGKLLAGSDGSGIYEIDLETGEIRNLSTKDGLQSGVILRMTVDTYAQGIWISNGSTLAFWNEDGIKDVPDVEAGVGSIFDIISTEQYIWLTKSFGLIRITREDLINGTQEFETLTRKDGLTSSITANSWNCLSAQGRLIVCTGNGVYYLDTQDIYRNLVPPRVSVSYIATDDATIYGSKDIEVPQDAQRLTLQLDLLSFAMEGGMLEYYLEGFDRTPIRLTGSSGNRVNYTNLPGGEYVFHLKGYNADGTESETLSFTIVKKRSFFERQYRYIWLLMMGIVLVLAAVVIVQRINRRRMLRRQQEYRRITEQMTRIVAKTVDAKDKYTSGHSHRVAAYAVEIGRRFGLNEDQLEQLRYSGLLHDIGKIGIPDSILNKKSHLTDEEYAVIKNHTTIGGDILKEFTLMPGLAEGALCHHERYDGKGYNKGLSGEEIPLFARIISVADAFDAMNSSRVYNPAMSKEIIVAELEKGRGSQFDVRFAQIMLDMIRDGFEVCIDV